MGLVAKSLVKSIFFAPWDLEQFFLPNKSLLLKDGKNETFKRNSI